MSCILLLGAEGGFQGAGATSLKTCMRGAFEFDILDATLLAELTFGGAAALGIDDEDVGLDEVERGDEVDDTATFVDVGLLDGLDITNHEEAFLLREHGLAVLVLLIGGIGADAYIEVTKLGGLLEKFYMTAMKEVVAAGYKDFFIYHFTIYYLQLSTDTITYHP